MSDRDVITGKAGEVAPGYPVISTLEDIDVSGWEPAAIFRPVTLPGEADSSGDGE